MSSKKVMVIVFSLIIGIPIVLLIGLYLICRQPDSDYKVTDAFESYLENKYPGENFKIGKINYVFNESDFVRKYYADVSTVYNNYQIEFRINSINRLEKISEAYLFVLNSTLLENVRSKDIKEIFDSQDMQISTYIDFKNCTEDFKEDCLKYRDPLKVFRLHGNYKKGVESDSNICESVTLTIRKDLSEYDKNLLVEHLNKLQNYYDNQSIKYEGYLWLDTNTIKLDSDIDYDINSIDSLINGKIHK